MSILRAISVVGLISAGCFGGGSGGGGSPGSSQGGGSVPGLPGTSSTPGDGLPGTADAPSGGGGGRISSGVSPGERLDSLSSSEQDALCEATFEFLDSLLGNSGFGQIDCIVNGLQVAAFEEGDPVEACEEFVEDCEPDSTELDFDSGNCMVDVESDCRATVADFEACLNDSVDALDQAFSGISCDFAGDPDAPVTPSAATPASCARLDDLCPEINASDIPGL